MGFKRLRGQKQLPAAAGKEVDENMERLKLHTRKPKPITLKVTVGLER